MKSSPSIATLIFTAVLTSALTAAATVWVMFRFDLLPPSDKVMAPDLSGLDQQAAQTRLEAQGLRLLLGGKKVSLSAPAGTVLNQTPPPGAKLSRGAAITVTLAAPAPSVTDIKSRSIAEATVLLEQAGFKIQLGEPASHPSIAAGKIATQTPASGIAYEPGRSIVVQLSTGPGTIPVPKVSHMFLQKAKKTLKAAGFKVGRIKWDYTEDWDAYWVLSQNPAAGQPAQPDTAIDLVVNQE